MTICEILLDVKPACWAKLADGANSTLAVFLTETRKERVA